MTLRADRPKGWTNRDVLCGVLAAAGSQMKIPCALDVAAKACEPLWTGALHNPTWCPDIRPMHAHVVIAYAGEAFKAGGISKAEYDFVCDKARRVLVRNQPLEFPNAQVPEATARADR